MIDWDQITEQYNLMKGRKFSTYEMLKYIYNRVGNLDKVADYIGVSVTSLTRKMDLLNVPRVRKSPWPESIQSKLTGIPTKRLSKMTAKEIATYIGCTIESIYRALNVDGREYKKIKS